LYKFFKPQIVEFSGTDAALVYLNVLGDTPAIEAPVASHNWLVSQPDLHPVAPLELIETGDFDIHGITVIAAEGILPDPCSTSVQFIRTELERISYSSYIIGATVLAKTMFTNTDYDGVTKLINERRNGELTVIQLYGSNALAPRVQTRYQTAFCR